MSSTDFQQQHLSSFLSFFLSFLSFCLAPGGAILPSRPAGSHGRRAQGRQGWPSPSRAPKRVISRPSLDRPSTAARLERVGFSPRPWLCFDELHLRRLILPKTRGGARFWWHRCHTLICGGIQQLIPTMMQYTHRQRGSEAAVPILVSGMKAIGCGEQPLPRVVFWQIVAQKRRCGQKLMIRFSLY